MQGGLASCSFSRYCEKFLALAINARIDSSTAAVLGFTCVHVRLSLRMGAVPSAETIEVSVE